MSILKYVTEDGQILLITSRSEHFEVTPLGHHDLVNAALQKTPVTIQLRNLNVTPDFFENDSPRKISFPIKPTSVYGLIDGGWLPIPWSFKNTALIDSNIFISIEKLIHDPTHPDEDIKNFFGADVQRVSSIFYALEGISRRFVTEAEFNSELDRAEQALQKILPAEKIESLDATKRSGIYDILRHQSRDTATKLLIKAAPMLADQIGKTRQQSVESKILKLAKELGISNTSFVVLALLSCIYDGGKKIQTKVQTPGRSVIKPKTTYTEYDAYNAITDIYMLDFLHNMHALFPEWSLVCYTKDIGLAALWTCMQPCQRNITKNFNDQIKTKVTFPLDFGLFPALSPDETLNLKNRLLNF